MSPRRRARALALGSLALSIEILAVFGCGDERGDNFASNSSAITLASSDPLTTDSGTGASGTGTSSTSGDTTQSPTTGETASSSPPCAELTLCPEPTTQDPTAPNTCSSVDPDSRDCP